VRPNHSQVEVLGLTFGMIPPERPPDAFPGFQKKPQQ
jgi:hypothetical protein